MTQPQSRLGVQAIIIMGQSPPGESYNKKGLGIPLLSGPTEFGPEHPIEQQWTTSPTKLCKRGDILFCVRGATTGRLNVADKEYCLGRGVATIRAIAGKFDERFLLHVLRSGYAKFQARGVGSTFINISSEELSNFEVPLVPFSEQRRIAAILDQAEALRAKRRHVLAQLDSLTQALFLDLFGDPQANSRDWPVKKLGELCEAAIDCPHSTPVYATSPTPHPCVRSSDIQDATLDFTAAKYVEPEEYQKRIARGRPRAGDVIYCREGARFGNAARVNDDTQLCLGQRMMLLRPRVDRATTEFLWAFLSSRAAYRQAIRALDGSASPHVNVRDIVAFRVPVPPLSLQREFAAQVSAVERLKSAQRSSLAKLDALFASLQHRAFRGEL